MTKEYTHQGDKVSPARTNNKITVMNNRNQIISMLVKKYKYVEHFSKGLLEISTNEGIGIFSINRNEFIVPPISCSSISSINNSLFLITKACDDYCNSKIGIFSAKSKSLVLGIVYDCISETIGGKYLRVGTGECWDSLFSIKNESLVVPSRYCALGSFTDTLFIVRSGYGYSNEKGVFCTETHSLILPIEYENVVYLSQTLFAVKTKDDIKKSGIFSTETNSFIFNINYYRVEKIYNSYYCIAIRTDDDSIKYGVFCTKNNSLILPFEYEDIKLLTGTLVKIKHFGSYDKIKYDVFNLKTGKMVR